MRTTKGQFHKKTSKKDPYIISIIIDTEETQRIKDSERAPNIMSPQG